MPDAQTLQRLSIAVEAFGIQIESHCSLVDGLVECTEAVADDLFGPAGLIPRATSYYQFDDGQLFFNLERATSPFWCGGDPTGPYSRYLIDLRIWSAGAYPELESYWLWGEPIDSPLAIPCTFYPFRTPEAAQQIAPIIAEFIDQSDEWPLAAPHGPGWGEGETEAALSTIDNLYAALNSGDVEAALDILVDTTSDERLAQMLRLSVDGLNAQFTYDCTPDPNLRKISCLEGVDDDLYGPAGITNESTVTYTYTRDKLIVDQMSQSFVCHTEPSGQTGNFLMGLRVWASNNHPELERYWLWGEPIDSPLAIPCTVYPFSRPESAIEIANIVSEFVAESTSWPIARP
jgi:hypothetical protein